MDDVSERAYESFEKVLRTPKDLSNADLETKASTLTLHFIGYLVKPIGIDEETYRKALEAFNNNRGKTEREIEAVLKAISGETERS